MKSKRAYLTKIIILLIGQDNDCLVPEFPPPDLREITNEPHGTPEDIFLAVIFNVDFVDCALIPCQIAISPNQELIGWQTRFFKKRRK